MTVMVFAATALILVHFYALSMPVAIVSLVIFLLIGMLRRAWDKEDGE